MSELATVPEPDEEDPSAVPVIESDPDAETRPFKIAYRRGGERVEEEFAARITPPFSIFRRLHELELASASAQVGPINLACRRLFEVALTDESSGRLMRLVEGDQDEVGVITSRAIGGVVDMIREMHLKQSPTRRGSSNGGGRTARTSSAARSGKASTSTRSRSKKG